MKKLNCMLVVSLGLFSSFAGYADSDCGICPIMGKIAFVQGGASGSGNGTLFKPYSQLALAQADKSWQTLIVLPGKPLDGGITVRSGSSIFGTVQSIITNSSIAANGGNGIVVQSGDVCIQNIKFQNTWGSAVRYDNARNLAVKNVLITGHNQGELSFQLDPVNGLGLYNAGILGVDNNNGSTNLCDVLIENNHTGPGVIDKAFGKANRNLVVNNCEFANLGSSAPDISGVENAGSAIVATGYDQGTNYTINITGNKIHNPTAIVGGDGFTGVLVLDVNANVSGVFSGNIVTNLFNAANPFGVGLKALAQTSNIASKKPTNRASLNLSVKNNTFDEQPANILQQDYAINFFLIDSVGSFNLSNNAFSNLYDFYDLAMQGQSNETGVIANNTGTSSDALYSIETLNTLFGSSPVTNIIEIDAVKSNNYTGGNLGAIQIVSNGDGLTEPWSNLAVNVTGNCFTSPTAGADIGMLSIDFGSGGAGNATVTAKRNNITNFASSISDGYSAFGIPGANVNYNAEQNWWGPSGPVNIVNLGTGTIDVSNPLSAPIPCPINSCSQ